MFFDVQTISKDKDQDISRLGFGFLCLYFTGQSILIPQDTRRHGGVFTEEIQGWQ